jgi:hypothetical protein
MTLKVLLLDFYLTECNILLIKAELEFVRPLVVRDVISTICRLTLRGSGCSCVECISYEAIGYYRSASLA